MKQGDVRNKTSKITKAGNCLTSYPFAKRSLMYYTMIVRHGSKQITVVNRQMNCKKV